MASDDIYNLLNPLLDDCMGLFNKDQSSTCKSFVQSLKSIHSNAIHIRPIAVDLVAKVAYRYDASPEIKANGYRSLLALLESLLHIIAGHLQKICKERKNVFFRANQYSDKLRALAQNLHQMRALFGYAQILIGVTPDGSMFAAEHESDDILHDCEIMAKSCFYSHVQGFQYYPGIQPIIQALSMFTASYNDITQHSSVWHTTKSLFNSGKYVVSPSVLGRKIEKIYSGAGVNFFKAFFSLPEMGVGVLLPNLVGENVKVNRIFNIPPKMFELETVDGDKVEINKAPCSGHNKHVKARLISAVLRCGQDSTESPSLSDNLLDTVFKVAHKPKSRTLLFFCHGGGFIALTSKSYEVVLREWTKELDCPIFSIDYSLAPESPFPEAFEECFYAYAWALKNARLLGTTAERVIFAGDSAGGNLVLSVAMRAATYGIKVPDALLCMYPSAVVRLSASPSRLLAVMDPLLPHCMLSACLCAYTGFRTEEVDYNTEEHKLLVDGDCRSSSHNIETPSDSLLSPSKQSITDNSIITTFLQDVGEGLGRLGPLGTATSNDHQPDSETWWDDEIFTSENEYKPESTSENRSSVSGFVRGLSRRLSGMLMPSNPAPKANTYWDDEFDMVSLDRPDIDSDIISESDDSFAEDVNQSDSLTDNNSNHFLNGSDSSAEEAHFKVKLANNFTPLKSKFFGKRTKVYHTALVKNPYISPALASDDMLRKLPYLDIVGCELDPLFDDAVTLSKRLHKIGHPHQFHIVRGLPHGFLSIQMCKETKDASKMCLNLLKNKILGSAV